MWLHWFFVAGDGDHRDRHVLTHAFPPRRPADHHADNPGLFQAADGGTPFLNEVAELPLSMQVKLLRAIQEKNIRPVGASIEVPVDVRILSATHKDLSTLVNEGRLDRKSTRLNSSH